MEALKTFSIFILLLTVGFSATININSCGSYTSASTADVINFTGDIYANSGSTITNGACVYLIFSSAGVGRTTDLSGRTITQNGSTATIGLSINVSASSVAFAPIKNITIANFETAMQNTLNPSGNAQLNYTNFFNLNSINSSFAFKGLDLRNAGSIHSLNEKINIALCNMSGSAIPVFINLTSSNIAVYPNISVSIIENCNGLNYMNETVIYQNAISEVYSMNRTAKLAFTSNKLFVMNFANVYFSVNNSGKNTQILNISNATSTTATTSASQYLFIPSIEYEGVGAINSTEENITNNILMNGKMYYCVGGYCNPIQIENKTNWPFYINVPDTLSPAQITNNYTELYIYWKQGFDNYLVASSKNSEDSTFYLQPNGFYTMVLNNGTTNTSYNITNSCPSVFSVCAITLLSSTGNVSSLLMPTGNCTWSANYTSSNQSAANATCCASASRTSTLTFQYYLANGTNVSYSYTNASYCDALRTDVIKAEVKIDGFRVYLSERPFLSLDSDYGFLFIIFLIPLTVILRRPSYVAGAFSLVVFLGWAMGVISSDFGFVVSVVAALFAVIFFKGDM